MKYKLNEELRYLEKLKMPANVKLLPAMNMLIRNFKCKSDENVTVKEYRIPGYEGEEISILSIEPKNIEEVLPCLVFFHGGGFMLKASFAHYELAKEYSAKLQCKVICVDYRLAPEYPFPTPVEDCFETYKWVLNNANELNIDRNKIMIAGDSAGGNLAAAVTLMARDRNIQIPGGAMLIYPVTDRKMASASMKKYSDAPVWDLKLSKMMWNAYLGKQNHEHIEYASLLEADSFKNFPKTYIEVAEFDCLHDEGVLLYERLKQEGIEAELHEVIGACHGFETLAESNITRECVKRRIEWLQEIIKKQER